MVCGSIDAGCLVLTFRPRGGASIFEEKMSTKTDFRCLIIKEIEALGKAALGKRGNPAMEQFEVGILQSGG
jgi:hypothetical protein